MSKKITEKFTSRSKQALCQAAKESQHLGLQFVDTEHILLGILSDESSVAYKVLSSFQVETARIKESVIASTDRDQSGQVPNKKNKTAQGFSESAQEAIAFAALQAYLWGSSYVGTEHILCGLAKTSSGLACHILRSWGITYDLLKHRVENYTSVTPQPMTIKETNTPLLNNYGRDLTALANENSLDPVFQREGEIMRVLQVLSRRVKNNPVLLGDAGVGKTAIVEGLAQKIVSREVPKKFINTRVVSLDLGSLVAGTRFRGDFEERLMGIIDEIKRADNIILFIDEVHTIVGAGGAGGALDAANILKPALSRGELRCIGATTAEEYAEFVEDDTALERRFQPIYINEPNIETTISILNGLKSRYESYHGIKIYQNAISSATKLAHRYLIDRHLPDSAIDVLDEAASKKTVSLGQLPKGTVNIDDKLEKIAFQKDQLVREERWQDAIELRNEEKKYRKKLGTLVGGKINKYIATVDEKDVAETVSVMTGIPIDELTQPEAQKLINLEKYLGKYVVGQNHVLKQVAGVLRRNRVGLRDPSRPTGSFMFLGISGVGKTLVAETLAQVLFDDIKYLIRLDMSEFSERHTVARIVGAPPGYVGYEEGGELTEKLRRNPYSVILLDEIEKAHPEIFNTLLQVLDNGQLTDGRGKTVNFRNSIIIMTSNVGGHLIKKEGDIGFNKSKISQKNLDERYQNISQKLQEELHKTFKPEFLNRIDSTIVFKPLNKMTARKIANILVKEVAKRLKQEYKMKLKVDTKVFGFLVEKGFSEEYGAREMKRVITDLIENPLSEKILSGQFKKGQLVRAKVEKSNIVLK